MTNLKGVVMEILEEPLNRSGLTLGRLIESLNKRKVQYTVETIGPALAALVKEGRMEIETGSDTHDYILFRLIS